MSDSFGARLRQRREERQIALSAIADETKIKLSLLEALEHDDVSHWPAGIFRRAYIRAYAHMIGLDPDEVVREFLLVHPEPISAVDAAAAVVAAAEEASRRHSAPPTRLRTMVDSALGSLARRRRHPGDEVATAPAARPEPGLPAEEMHRPDPLPQGSGAAFDPDDTLPGFSLDRLQAQTATGTVPASDAAQPLWLPPAAFAEAPADKPGESSNVGGSLPAEAGSHGVAAPPPEADLEAVAGLCTAFARVVERHEIQLLLQETARLLDATGLIVWIWDGPAEALRPALVHGYSDKVLAQLPTVRRDGDNPTAAAFRTGQTCELPGASQSSGALVVPMLTPEGCAGVLALELQPGIANTRSIRAVATILATVLTQLVVRVRLTDTRPQVRSPLRVRR